MRVGEGRMRALSFLVSSWWAEHSSSRIGALWRRELSYLGVIREERTVGWCSCRCLGHFISYTFLSNPLCYRFARCCCVAGEGGREFEEIVSYMVEQGKAHERLPIKLST